MTVFNRLTWNDVDMLAEVLTRMGVAVIGADLGGAVKVWNRGAEDLYGWTARQAIGGNILERASSPAEQRVAVEVMNAVASGSLWEGDFVAPTRSGASIEVHVVDAPVFGADGSIEGVVGVSRPEPRSERAAVVEMAELRDLYRVGVRAVERDRQRIADELHDELGQYLTALRTEILWLHSRSEGEAAASAARADASVVAALTSLRRIVDELHPSLLEQLGVCAAVEAMVEAFGSRLGVDARMFVDHERLGWLEREVELAVFRIAQGSLTNVERHAKGFTRVAVEMVRETDVRSGSDDFVLRVTNDGVPYNGTRGYGIRSMMDRAAAVGGRASIVSTPTGAVVEMRVPSERAFTEQPVNLSAPGDAT